MVFHVEQQLLHSYRLLAGHSQIDDLTTAQIKQLLDFLSLLEGWTEKVDLVAPAPLGELLERHIVDSLAAHLQLLFHVEHPQGPILDVGSGGGLPGVVLAIMNPKSQVVCCEPRGKRCDFLREVRRRLAINLEVRQSRIEELQLDIAPTLTVTRALGLDELFVHHSGRLLAAGGKACILAGPSHLNASTIPSTGRFEGYYRYHIPSLGAERQLAVWSF